VLPAFFVVSLVQEPEVSNVMSEDCALLADGISQLLGITLSCAASVQDMDGIVPSLPENFAQYRTDILIQQQGNLGH
jgi:hypothetical protein